MSISARNQEFVSRGIRTELPGIVMRLTTFLFLSAMASNVAMAQGTDGLPNRGDAFVAMSRSFAFYSDSVGNLHDFLLRNARSTEAVEPASECLAALPREQRLAFEHAHDYYGSAFANGSGERLLLALRYRLAGFGDFDLAEPAAIAAVLAELSPAAPAYEACWWQRHDARNRSWIAALLPLLVAHEHALHTRLAQLYGRELARPLPVDVVGYAGFGGASSVTDPDHLLFSSANPANAGYAALEMVFHEASHTIFGPRVGGPLWEELERAHASAGSPPSRDFWHALLFFTTGKAVQARLAEQGVADYRPYAYSQGLFDRPWAAFREPLERVWQPYVDERLPMREAARQIIEALQTPEP